MSEKNNMSYVPYTLSDVYDAVEKAKNDGTSFTVFSTFAGGGGSSTGYKLAGGDVRGIVEFQKVGVRGYLTNYPNTKFFCKDIRDITGEKVLKRLRMKPRELDIFDASPPCPPFSMSGSKRKGWNKTKTVYGFKQTNIEDLSFDVARLVGVVQPKVFICENVKGMTMEYAHDHFQSIMHTFAEQGYEVGWRVFNAKNFGVPQGRERVFIVGVRGDVWETVTGKDLSITFGRINLFEEEKLSTGEDKLPGIWPEPSESIPTLKDSIYELMPYYESKGNKDNIAEHNEMMEITKKQARWKYFSQMPVHKLDENGDTMPDSEFFTSKSYAEYADFYRLEKIKEWEEMPPDLRYLMPKDCWINRKTGERRDEESLDKDIEENRGDWKNVGYARKKGFQVRRVSWNHVSHTLTERGLQVGTGAHIHPQEKRGFTSIEAKRIMSLPDDYYLDGNLNQRLARVGLMVAPRQMESIARKINESILQPYKEKLKNA